MFESLSQAIKWVKQNYLGCSFSVTEQKDGPTVISVKSKDDNQIRTVVYARQTKAKAGWQRIPYYLRLEHLEIDAPLVKALEEGASIKLIYDLGIPLIIQGKFLGNSL